MEAINCRFDDLLTLIKAFILTPSVSAFPIKQNFKILLALQLLRL